MRVIRVPVHNGGDADVELNDIVGFIQTEAGRLGLQIQGGGTVETSDPWEPFRDGVIRAGVVGPQLTAVTAQDLGLNPDPFAHRPDGVEDTDL